jgi:hypothetical protein
VKRTTRVKRTTMRVKRSRRGARRARGEKGKYILVLMTRAGRLGMTRLGWLSNGKVSLAKNPLVRVRPGRVPAGPITQRAREGERESEERHGRRVLPSICIPDSESDEINKGPTDEHESDL